MITIPSPSAITSALPNIPSSPCGLNLKLDGLESLMNGLNSAIGELTAGANGIFDRINDLKSQLDSNLNACMAQLQSVLSEIKIPSLEFPKELMSALNLIQTDTTAFLNAIADLKIKFPSIDIDGILNKLFSDINFDFCKMVPNVKIIDGVEVTKAIPEMKADKSPEKLPTPAVGPTVLPPEMPKRLGIITDQIKAELDSHVSSGNMQKIKEWGTKRRDDIHASLRKNFRLNPDTDEWIPTGKVKITELDEELGLVITLISTAKEHVLAKKEASNSIGVYKFGPLVNSIAPDINVEK